MTNQKRRWRLLAAGLIGLGLMTGMLAAGEAIPAQKPESEKTLKGKCIVFFGVYTQWYKFDQALRGYALQIANAHSERVQNFPSVKELFGAKLIVLSDVSGKEFSEGQIKLLKTYVEKGGGLLALGGPFAFGLGDWRNNGMADWLPVTLEPQDLKWEKSGKALEKANDSDLLAGVDLSAAPQVYWIHKVKPKEGAQVLLKAGDYPVLVKGTYGKGKVVVFCGTPMGLPGKDQTPFWEWKGWLKLMENTASWLGQREEASDTGAATESATAGTTPK